MKTFIDTVTGQPWQFDDCDDVRFIDGVYQVFDVKGKRLASVPETLEPGELPAPPEPTLDELKAAKLQTINLAAQAMVAPYMDSYPRFEVDTWGIQKAEAEAFALDDSMPTPFCDIAAAGRGIDRLDFIGKVSSKAILFTEVSAAVAGYRQRLEGRIIAAQSADDLELIQWFDTLEDPEVPPVEEPT